jgi:hypothetical protein
MPRTAAISALCAVLLWTDAPMAEVAWTAAPGSAYPNKDWEKRTPEQVGRGCGCVVRHGYLVFTWGDAAKSGDIAGSLVNIAFHAKASAGFGGTTLQLIESKTVLADAQAAMILSPGLDWTAVLTSDWVQSLI